MSFNKLYILYIYTKHCGLQFLYAKKYSKITYMGTAILIPAWRPPFWFVISYLEFIVDKHINSISNDSIVVGI